MAEITPKKTELVSVCAGIGGVGYVRRSLVELTGKGSVIAEGDSELLQVAVSIRPALSCGPSAKLPCYTGARGSRQQKAQSSGLQGKTPMVPLWRRKRGSSNPI